MTPDNLMLNWALDAEEDAADEIEPRLRPYYLNKARILRAAAAVIEAARDQGHYGRPRVACSLCLAVAAFDSACKEGK